jgi:pyrroloquinoline quinone biosynthesis protein D
MPPAVSLDSDTLLSISPLHRLQWEEAQQKHVILYPEGMVELNGTAAAILLLCDGSHTVQEIVTELERQYQVTGIEADVRELLEAALENGWIRQVCRQ